MNASAYLLNGDTLGFSGVWNVDGDDIYYDAGKVKIGEVTPAPYASTLSVRGSVVLASDSAREDYVGSFFALDVDSVFFCDAHLDSLELTHHHAGMGVIDTLGADTLSAYVITGECFGGVATVLAVNNDNENFHHYISIVENNEMSGMKLHSHKNTTGATLSIVPTGVGVNTDSPDTELHVNGNIKQSITTGNVSNPPTDAELDSFFTSPASKGDGWTVYIQDDNSDNFYQVVASGNNWIVFAGVKAQ